MKKATVFTQEQFDGFRALSAEELIVVNGGSDRGPNHDHHTPIEGCEHGGSGGPPPPPRN